MDSPLQEVRVSPRPLDWFEPFLGRRTVEDTRDLARRMAQLLGGREIWNINSTAQGGGVAEMLQTIIGYARGAGIDTRWLVIGGDREFFRITKRIHNALHGDAGDGTPLDDAARRHYEEVIAANATEIASYVQPGDIAIVHDPQPAGLLRELSLMGVRTIWRCHIGHDGGNQEVDRAWRFLLPYLEHAEAFAFTRQSYVPEMLRERRVFIVAPTIDPLSAKNQPLEESSIRGILTHTGIIADGSPDLPRRFCRADGSPGRVGHRADVITLGSAPPVAAPLVVQVSRWDRLKDHLGVLRGFARFLDVHPESPAHLVLAGPNVHAVADDPEGAEVFGEIVDAWRALPHAERARAHLVNLPMVDVEENAAIVNALQRHATVIVQKSLHEGFGLTVTEAMWKGRPVIASRVGGIQDQIEHGISGLLLDDPGDPDELARALAQVLDDPDLAASLGEGAYARVTSRFLGLHSLLSYAQVLQGVLAAERERPAVAADEPEAPELPSAAQR